MNYGSSNSCWKPWKLVRFDLILKVRYMHINSNLNPLTRFTSSRSTEFKDILPWNISQIITKTTPVSKFIGKSVETETTTSEYPNGGKAIVEQILVSKEINKSKRAGLWESQSGILVGKFRSFQLGHISLLHTEQESQESWTQGKIHIQQNCNKGLEYL